MGSKRRGEHSLTLAPLWFRTLVNLVVSFLSSISACLPSLPAGETTTDHLDILDDNSLDQEDGYGSEHHNHKQQQQRAQNHPRYSSSWAEQGERGGGARSIPNPWGVDDASAKLGRPGRAEGRGFEGSWEGDGDGDGGEGRAWKHEDLKQLLQV